MNDNISSQSPEVPDPAQLDLFGEKQTPGFVTANDQEIPESEENALQIRSPPGDTPDVPEIGKKLIQLNEAQKQNASFLLRKSRELVLRSREIRNEENDLAR
jgi:hypothetical protein